MPLLALPSNRERQQLNDVDEEELAARDPLDTSSNSRQLEISTGHDSSNTSVLDASTSTFDQNDNLEIVDGQHLNESDADTEWSETPIDRNDDSEDDNLNVDEQNNESDAPSEVAIAIDLPQDLTNGNIALKQEPVFAQLADENAQAADDVFNESFENCDESGDIMVHSKDILPMPIAERNPYEVKQNDIISGNMAFAKNVSIFIHIECKFLPNPSKNINIFHCLQFFHSFV